MPQAVDCDLFLYADDTGLLFQHKDLERIKEELTKNFSNICDWFVDNKFSIHFGEDKTKTRQRCRNEKINWLPVYERLNQYLCSNSFKFSRKLVLYIFMIHIDNLVKKSIKYEIFCFETKTSFKRHVFWSKKFVVSGTTVWNSLPTDQKLTNSLNNLKHS